MSLEMKVIIATIISVLAAIGVTYMIPVPASWHGAAGEFYPPLIISMLMAVTHGIAAVLFFMGLHAYKTRLRFAYGAIAMGSVLVGVGMVQLPLIDAFNLSNSIYMQSGIVILPFLLSGLASYVGVRNFAHLVGVKTWLTKASVIIPGIIVLSALSALLPHAALNRTEIAHDIFTAILVWTTSLHACAALIALTIRSHVGSHYVNAVAWLSLGFLGTVVVEFLALINALFFGGGTELDSVLRVIGALNGLIFVKAGVAFNKTRDY